MDVTIIEVMPLATSATTARQYLPLSMVRAALLSASRSKTWITGPVTGPLCPRQRDRRRLGFITPMTHNFCESCNRVRITAPARSICAWARRTPPILRAASRVGIQRRVYTAIDEAITASQGHDFVIDRRHKRPALSRT